MKKLLITLLILSSLRVAFASITTAQPGTKNWTQSASWTNGVPGCFDTIHIPVGSTMNVNSQIDLTLCPNPITIIVEGTLKFKTGQKLFLPGNSIVQVAVDGELEPGGGGGSANLIEIGGTVLWTSGNGPLQGPAAICEFCSSLLGVEYLGGYFEIDGRDLHFYWETGSENDNDYFTLERSIDGNTWEHIAQIPGQGTTTETSYYHTQDRISEPNIYYYSLYQTDLDGEKTLLEVFTATFNYDKSVVHEYDLTGRPIDKNYHGIVIQQYNDGSSTTIVR